VLEDIACRVEGGSVLLVTGPSGCGKSTLIRAANGLIPHFFKGDLRGAVTIDGADSRRLSVPEIAERAGSLFQDPEQQFFTLDVESEIAFAHEQRGCPTGDIRARVDRIADRLGIAHLLDSSLFSISEGEKQKTALAAVLSLDPAAILLDEPTANLDHESTRQLAVAIGEMKAAGIAVVIVDHRLYWLDGLVDHVLVLDRGRIVDQGAFERLHDPEFRAAHGLRRPDLTQLHDAVERLPSTHAWSGASVRMRGLSFAYKRKPPLFVDRDFRFPMGRVTAVVGPNGSGKTTLARLLTGLSKPSAGSIAIAETHVAGKNLLKRAGLVFQNSDHQLFMNTVERELAIAGRALPRRRRQERAAVLLEKFGLAEFARAHPQALSGGQKQRLVIACALIKQPDILILDEPTSGLDGRNMGIMSRALRGIAESGTCVIVITHDAELIAESSDFVLDLGARNDQIEPRMNLPAPSLRQAGAKGRE
jgi:energy-coupling factor transport system ATP-binding protein